MLSIFSLGLGGGDIKPLVPALYVFGDSILDSGNNNYLATLAKADYPPYGVDFDGGATGRFTNGKTSADFIGIRKQYFQHACCKIGSLF